MYDEAPCARSEVLEQPEGSFFNVDTLIFDLSVNKFSKILFEPNKT